MASTVLSLSITTYALLTSYVFGQSLHIVSQSPYNDITCKDGVTESCTIYCDYDQGARYRTIDCGSAGLCVIYCTIKRCMQDTTIIATNSLNFQSTCGDPANNCLKNSKLYLPDNGNATVDMGESRKCLRNAEIHAGTNTQNVIVHLDSTDITKDACENIEIYASTAQFLYVSFSNSLQWRNGRIECPVNSNYNGPEIAPCIIDASGGGYFYGGTDIYAPKGAPYGVQIIGGQYTGSNYIICTQIDKLNGPENGWSVLPIDKSDDCWWTLNPTMDPTTNPTIDPTKDPTKSPTADPTKHPTQDPTTNPTKDPTKTPTNDPTIDPTTDPTIDPTDDPTIDPTIDPTTDPTIDPTVDPTTDPSLNPTTDPTTDPTWDPTTNPTQPTSDPTSYPTMEPTYDPTIDPTIDPTFDPSRHPTEPTIEPTTDPTIDPTTAPSNAPTLAPSLAPSLAPTLTPSLAPSVAPSLAPSLAPTIAPSLAPSIAPTLAPSLAPTTVPSLAPTLAPTLAPSLSPTLTPSLAPSVAPSLAPSLSPTVAPSLAPSIAPTLAPSLAPTIAPSLAPTRFPTLAPTLAPTFAPSIAPTTAPTVIGEFTQAELFMYYNMTQNLQDIILTIFNKKLSFATQLAIRYAPFQNNYEQYKFIDTTYTCVAFTISSFNTNDDDWDKTLFECGDYVDEIKKSESKRDPRYKPSTKGAQYLAIMRVIMTGNDRNESEHRVAELTRLLDYNHYNNDTSISFSAFSAVEEGCMMGDTTHSEICTTFLGLNLEYFKVITLDAGFVTEFKILPVPPTFAEILVETLKYIIYSFMAVCFIISITGKLYAKRIGSDNVKAFGILWFSLYTWDFYSDVMFCARLSDATEWLLFTVSMIFIFLPWIMNLLQLFNAQKDWTTDPDIQEGVSHWFVNWNLLLILACVISGNSFGSIELANSNLFGLDLFAMGLPPHSLKEFQSKRFYSSVLLENIPQLVVQIYFLTKLGSFDEPTFNALLSSSISVVLSVVDIWSAKRLISVMDKARDDDTVDINKIEFMIRSNSEIDGQKKILVTRPRSLAKAIAETLTVDARNIEIYQLMPASDGIKVGFTVYSIDYNCDQMIQDLCNKRLALQYLLANRWHLKQFPRLKNIQKSQATNEEIMMQIAHQIAEQKKKTTASTLMVPNTHTKTISTIKLIKLTDLNKDDMRMVRAMDPELMKLDEEDDTQIIYQRDDDNDDIQIVYQEDDINVLPPIHDETQWRQYMQNLEKYALSQKQIYESHPIAKGKPLKMVNQKEEWPQYTQNIHHLLDERAKIMDDKAKDKRITVSVDTVNVISNLDDFMEESTSEEATQNLHQRVESMFNFDANTEMQTSLLQEFDDKDKDEKVFINNIWNMNQESNKKYEITIDAEPLGIVLEPDDDGYNTMIADIADTKRTLYDLAGIKVGMILSDINGVNVLGWPYNIVNKRLTEFIYPVKIAFMADTNAIRFDWVLSAACFMRYALNKKYKKINLIKFLAEKGMSRLEVRYAFYLKNEHRDTLPLLHYIPNRNASHSSNLQRVKTTGNDLLSLFMNSEYAIDVDATVYTYTPPSIVTTPKDDTDKSEALRVFGLTPVDIDIIQNELSKQSKLTPTQLSVQEKELIEEMLFPSDDEDEDDTQRPIVSNISIGSFDFKGNQQITPQDGTPATPLKTFAKNVSRLFSQISSSPKRPKRPTFYTQRPQRGLQIQIEQHIESAAKKPKPITQRPKRPKRPLQIQTEQHKEPHRVSTIGTPQSLTVNKTDKHKRAKSSLLGTAALKSITKRVSVLFSSKNTQKREMKKIMDVPTLSYMRMQSSVQSEDNNDTLPKQIELQLVQTVSSQAPRHSKLTAHSFLSQLQLAKVNSNDRVMIPKDCYTQQHFVKAMDNNDIELDEAEVEDIVQELLDINETIENAITLISDSSFNTFVQNGAKSGSQLVKKFWTLVVRGKHHQDIDDIKEDPDYDDNDGAGFVGVTYD